MKNNEIIKNQIKKLFITEIITTITFWISIILIVITAPKSTTIATIFTITTIISIIINIKSSKKRKYLKYELTQINIIRKGLEDSK